jgi:hypothetical protein
MKKVDLEMIDELAEHFVFSAGRYWNSSDVHKLTEAIVTAVKVRTTIIGLRTDHLEEH